MNDDSQYIKPNQFKAQLLEAANQPNPKNQNEQKHKLLTLGCTLNEIKAILKFDDETARLRAEILMNVLERQAKAYKKQVRLKKKREREEKREWQISELMNSNTELNEESVKFSKPETECYVVGQREPGVDGVMIDNLKELMAYDDAHPKLYPDYIDIIVEDPATLRKLGQR